MFLLNKLKIFYLSIAGKFVAKKVANKTMKEVFDTYDYIADRNLVGSKSLNIGEEETLRCYKAMPYDKSGFCKAVGDKARYDYHHPWKFKKK